MSELGMMLKYPFSLPDEEHHHTANAVMALGDRHAEPETDKTGLPVGMVDYDLRCAIRNFFRVNGFEETRAHTAMLLEELAGRRLS